MWFWLRREVFMSGSERQCAAARAVLDKAGIAYEAVYRNGHNIAGVDTGRTFGRIGTGSASTGIYYLYTHRRDAQEAQEIIQMALRGL